MRSSVLIPAAFVGLCLARGDLARADACPGPACDGVRIAAAEVPRTDVPPVPMGSPETSPRRTSVDLRAALTRVDVSSLSLPAEDDVRAEGRRTPSLTPWIWRELRRVAYARLPTHEVDRFEATWAPVIVEGPNDTVPGVGLEGCF